METTNLGAVGISDGGVYNPETVYKKYKVVSANGGSYMYINPTPAAGVPVTDASHWQQIAEKGDTGPSAYDAAVAGGYAGTEAEFNAANAGIEAAKDAALGAAETANEAAENAETAAYRSMLWRKTVSGNPVSVYPVPESPLYPKVSGTFTQEGTGDPSPENIRPITPWLASGATTKVTRTGKNLLKNISPGPRTTSGITYTVQSDGSVVLSGSPTAANELFLSTSMELLPGSYVLSATGNAKIPLFVKTGTLVVAKATLTPKPFVVTEKLVVSVRIYCNSDATGFPLTVYPQIERGSTATPYEPYTESEITLTAPQEIPAGWMDNEGNGQITHGYIASYVDETVPDGWVSSIGELSAGAQVVYPLAMPIDITPTAAPLASLAQIDRVTPRLNVLTASTGNVELTYAKSPIKESDEIRAALAL